MREFFLISFREQDRLKKKLIAYDDFPWKLSSSIELPQGSEMLKYVGGVDMSFSKEDSSVACACLVVLELPSLCVVHHDLSLLRLHVPYVPGFLAFREVPVSFFVSSLATALLFSFASLSISFPEIGFLMLQAPVLLQLLKKMRDDQNPFYPQVLVFVSKFLNFAIGLLLNHVCESLVFALSESLLLYSDKGTDGGWKRNTSSTRY